MNELCRQIGFIFCGSDHPSFFPQPEQVTVTPVPEPSTILLIAFGIVAWLLWGAWNDYRINYPRR